MILGIGPYIGSFEQEFLTFRPYAKWVCEVTNCDDVYINTHYNRLFMYDFIKEENRIPINKDITRNEFNQKGYINKEIDVRNFNFLVRYFKDQLSKKTGRSKKNIDIEYINYTKRIKPVPIDKKVFTPITVPDVRILDEHKGKIVIIPHKVENIKRMEELINRVDDSIVIGDWSSTNFQDENVISNLSDYIENVYKYMIKYISEAKAVICPLSFWTAVCNIQSVPVISWGKNACQYKNDGIYAFENDKSVIFNTDKNINTDRIIGMIDYFLEEKVK